MGPVIVLQAAAAALLGTMATSVNTVSRASLLIPQAMSRVTKIDQLKDLTLIYPLRKPNEYLYPVVALWFLQRVLQDITEGTVPMLVTARWGKIVTM